MTAPLDDLPDLDELDRLAAAATPGPWEVSGSDSGHSQYELLVSVITQSHGDLICDLDGLTRSHFKEGPGPDDDGMADAAFIAASRSALPLLVARVRELELALGHAQQGVVAAKMLDQSWREALAERDALRDGIRALVDDAAPYPADERWTVVKDESLRALLTTDNGSDDEQL
jgi:hypothetical protein